ncbi:MAG TPA: hypothetical protein VFS05_06150 [Gemmatimonadaceae bacterium]|nr:hypothetical protein [Gemmatimonadaceae bacterium]
MTGSPRSRFPSRAAVTRAALALAAVVQLVLAVAVPLAEARGSRSAAAHVEEAGTSLHHAHIESLCPSCTALGLMATPPAPAHVLDTAVATAPRPIVRPRDGHASRVPLLTAAPRAPPLPA